MSAHSSPARAAASEVLRELIDARLLTSYEVREDEHEPIRRVEIIHESLLANWPRLVRWQTQDQEGAQLRDELRQAARTWDEHDRTDDLLWTGTAYREFRLWRERYPGGLTEVEEAFGSAMTVFAGRRRRQRRIAVGAFITILLTGLAVVGVFWQRSVHETLRAEAQKLFALAQIELETDRTASLAYATTSLEMADDQEVRKLAIKALWQGPQRSVIDDQPSWSIPFSPDGQHLVKSMEVENGPHLEVIASDGTGVVLDRIHESRRVTVDISPESNLLASWDWNNRPVPLTVALRSMSQPQPLATHRYEAEVTISSAWDGRRLLLVVQDDQTSIDALDENGHYDRIGTLGEGYSSPTMDWQTSRWLGAIRGNDVVVFEIADKELGQPRSLGRHPGARQSLFHPRGDFLITQSPDGKIRFWDPTGSTEPKLLQASAGLTWVSLAADGSILIAYTKSEAGLVASQWSLDGETPTILRRYTGDVPVSSDPAGKIFITNKEGLVLLAAPPEAEPIPIENTWIPSFHPRGDWLSTTGDQAQLWHLLRPLSIVITRVPTNVSDLEFERRGRFLTAAGMRNYWVRIWPLEGAVPAAPRMILETRERGYFGDVAVSPDGTHLLVTALRGPPLLVPVSEGLPRELVGHDDAPSGVAFSPSGRLAAVPSGGWSAGEPDAIHVWEVATGRHLEPVPLDSKPTRGLHFLSEDHLLVATESGLWKHGLNDGAGELLVEGTFANFAVSGNGDRAILRGGNIDGCGGKAVVFSLESGKAMELNSHGSGICSVDINVTGSIVVTGNVSGEIRVGAFSGEAPHLLVADSYHVIGVALDPSGRWVASTGLVSKVGGWSGDATIRLWPMPDLSKPPLHTLPREELIAKLKTLTNLRVVRDPESATGWTLTHDPFPGWETVPTW